MNATEDPSAGDPPRGGGKTIVRQDVGPEWEAAAAGETPEQGLTAPLAAPAENPDATIFDPHGGAEMPGWGAAGTMIVQDEAFASAGRATAGYGSSPLPMQAADAARKMSLDDLIGAREHVAYCTANPFIAAAAPLLMLFGDVRLKLFEVRPAALADRLDRFIREFERKTVAAGVSEEDRRIAKFVLCETADDIVGNLPGIPHADWIAQGMMARFFQAGAAGAGFFMALNKALADPEAHLDLLELMHACLSLGFEGQYRAASRKDGSLERVRRDIYETLRYFKAADADISPRWQGQPAAAAKQRRRVPLWSVAAAAVALVTITFFALRTLITNEGDALAGELLALNPSAPIAIERAGAVPLAEAPPVPEEAKPAAQTAQIDRIREALAKDIESGGLTIGTRGDFIAIEVNNALLFGSGKAEIKTEFTPLAGRIAAALDSERGPIRIVGHTDNVKPRKTSPFKSNYDLSVARAKAVEQAIAPGLGTASRITVEGKGDDEPIADDATAEGRARNRRVDVMVRREETL